MLPWRLHSTSCPSQPTCFWASPGPSLITTDCTTALVSGFCALEPHPMM